MIVFKTFWKIVNKYKFIVILYTVILILFAGINMNNNDTNANFVASKPDVLIINNDEDKGITKNLIEYITKNCNIVQIKNDDEAIDDALFYRDINYIIYIPENYRTDFLGRKNPEINIKSTGDYQSSLAEMILSRYVKVANIYVTQQMNENELISRINETLDKKTEIQVTSKLDGEKLTKAAFYYNFFNYSMIASLLNVVCLIIASFREEKVRKRTIISSMNYKKHNRQLLLSNSILALILWVLYVVLSIILIGDVVFTPQGLIMIANSFVFSICCLCMSFLIANLVNNKDAISGIVNVVGLGSSFLCGAFVPVEWLPDSVLKIAHILPSYWYIQNNETVKTMETVDIENLKPILTNMVVILGFSVLFIVLTNIVSKKKRKIG